MKYVPKICSPSIYKLSVCIIKTTMIIAMLLTAIIVWHTITPHSWRWLELSDGFITITIVLDIIILLLAGLEYGVGDGKNKYY